MLEKATTTVGGSPTHTNTTTPLTPADAEIEAMENAVGDGDNNNDSSSSSSSSSSDSDGGEALLAAAAATTKKRSAPSELPLPPAVRTVSTRLQAVGVIRRSERTRSRK